MDIGAERVIDVRFRPIADISRCCHADEMGLERETGKKAQSGRKLILLRVLFGLAAFVVTACQWDNSTIYDTDPFIAVEADFPATNTPAFIAAATVFAERRGLDVTVNEFGSSTFSIFIHDGPRASINLIALNTVTRGEIIVIATARSRPTPAQMALAQAWLAQARAYAGPLRPKNN